MLLLIIFTTFAMTFNILLDDKNIVENTNKISLIILILLIILIFYNIIIYKPENNIIKKFDKAIHHNNCRRKCCNPPQPLNIPVEKNNNDIIKNKKCDYTDLLHPMYDDELENEYFYKSNDDYHKMEKYVYEKYLS
jgi:hypothetical protein